MVDNIPYLYVKIEKNVMNETSLRQNKKKVFRFPLSIFSLFFYLCRLVKNVNYKTLFYV